MTSARRKVGERRASGRQTRYLLLLVVLLTAAGWLYSARQQVLLGQQLQQLVQDNRLQVEEIEQLQQRLRRLRIELLLAEQAADEQRDMVQDLEQQLFHQQQTLARYQSALRPDAVKPGLRIQAFEQQSGVEPGSFRFRIMLSRVGTEDDSISGKVQLLVEGLQNGKPATLQLPDKVDTAGDGWAFEFRYFQVLPDDGSKAKLRMPEGFEPVRVLVRARTQTGHLVERSFDWRAPASAESGGTSSETP